MTERLRLGLTIAAVVAVVTAILTQMIWSGVRPVLKWQRERQADYVAFEQVRVLRTRVEVEQFLTGWEGRDLHTPHCEAAARYSGKSPEVCRAAVRELAYRRKRPGGHPPGLAPTQILVVYDVQNHVIATTTFD